MPQPDQRTPAVDRRSTARPPPARHGELVVESAWRPADRPRDQPLPWRIAHGYAPERRAR